MATQLPDTRDYFTDPSILLDPYEYFENLRPLGPVSDTIRSDVVMVTGFKESLEVLLNTDDFSAVVTTEGPINPLPFVPEGDDITDLIDKYRRVISPTSFMISFDGDAHSARRSLIMGLFTPSRLKTNERYMNELADHMIGEAVAKGRCEIIRELAAPYVTLVIADMLGVPAEDRDKFREVIDAGPPAGNLDPNDPRPGPLEFMAGFFKEYVEDRRANPRDDVLTELATARYPDGTLPAAVEIYKTAMFLFAAGQDTSAKLLGNSIRRLADDRNLQRQLRDDRSLIAPFIEEVLRMEGSTKATFRLAKRNTRIGDRPIPIGTKVVIALAAANRDPLRWEDPQTFKLDRPRIKEHLAFARGAHVCAGAPLARAEVRVLLDKLFDQTSDISLSEDHHGTPGNRKLDYEASFIIRGLETLHVDLKPA